MGCQETWDAPDSVTPNCERGDNASLFRFIFYYGPLWGVIVAIGFLMGILVKHVHSIEKKLLQYGESSYIDNTETRNSITTAAAAKRAQERKHFKRSRETLKQAFWYIGAFLATWICPTIFQITFMVTNHTVLWPLVFMTALFVPIQGALNFIVYLRPKYLKRRKQSKVAGKETEFFLACWFRVVAQEIGIIDEIETMTRASLSNTIANND